MNEAWEIDWQWVIRTTEFYRDWIICIFGNPVFNEYPW